MTDISRVTVDPQKQEEGDRLEADDFGFPGVFVTTRSTSCNDYLRLVEKMQRKALDEKRKNKSLTRGQRKAGLDGIENATIRREAYVKVCLKNIEGLTRDKQPILFEDLKPNLLDPKYIPLIGICMGLAAGVGQNDSAGDDDDDDKTDGGDVGNSGGPSGGNSVTES